MVSKLFFTSNHSALDVNSLNIFQKYLWEILFFFPHYPYNVSLVDIVLFANTPVCKYFILLCLLAIFLYTSKKLNRCKHLSIKHTQYQHQEYFCVFLSQLTCTNIRRRKVCIQHMVDICTVYKSTTPRTNSREEWWHKRMEGANLIVSLMYISCSGQPCDYYHHGCKSNARMVHFVKNDWLQWYNESKVHALAINVRM